MGGTGRPARSASSIWMRLSSAISAWRPVGPTTGSPSSPAARSQTHTAGSSSGIRAAAPISRAIDCSSPHGRCGVMLRRRDFVEDEPRMTAQRRTAAAARERGDAQARAEQALDRLRAGERLGESDQDRPHRRCGSAPSLRQPFEAALSSGRSGVRDRERRRTGRRRSPRSAAAATRPRGQARRRW